jgi:hypothetical protein
MINGGKIILQFNCSSVPIVPVLNKYYKNKTIYLYGGSDGTRKNDAISRDTYFSEVEKWLIAAKWNVMHP